MKVKPPFLRTPFNYDVDAASDESGLLCADDSLAIQSEAEDADINTIVKRFGITGQLPTGVRAPTTGDFLGISSYHEAMNAIIQADSAFMELPADVRARFEHNPDKLIDFCNDPSNRAEAERLGLVIGQAGGSPGSQAPSASQPSPAGAPSPS